MKWTNKAQYWQWTCLLYIFSVSLWCMTSLHKYETEFLQQNPLAWIPASLSQKAHSRCISVCQLWSERVHWFQTRDLTFYLLWVQGTIQHNKYSSNTTIRWFIWLWPRRGVSWRGSSWYIPRLESAKAALLKLEYFVHISGTATNTFYQTLLYLIM